MYDNYKKCSIKKVGDGDRKHSSRRASVGVTAKGSQGDSKL